MEYIGGAGTVERLITGTPIVQKLIDKMNGETANQTRNSKIWIGTSSSGVKIRVILDNNGRVITAHPNKTIKIRRKK